MRRKIFDEQGHAHFVTFSCHGRRRLLEEDRPKRIVIHYLHDGLRKHSGGCLGFVVMPHHVHALLCFDRDGELSGFMQQWKRRSSIQFKALYRKCYPSYAALMGGGVPIWQPRYYDYNVFSEEKAREKLIYMHSNPVKAGLVKHPVEWTYSSARWYLQGKSVGVEIMSVL